MQPLITLKGATLYGIIVQTARLWLDGLDFKEIALDIWLLKSEAVGGTLPNLNIQTAASVEGPWTTVATINAAYTQTRVFLTSREGGTVQFQRLARWELDPRAASGNWQACFQICATMK